MAKILSVIRLYIRGVDKVNRYVGKATMYLIFVMMGVLLFAAFSRSIFDKPFVWVMEIAQFTMAAYYLLGGGFSMQQDAHVRMDVLYEKWGPKRKVAVDIVTSVALFFYLAVLVWGGWESSSYALEYGQKNYTAWAPPLAPIKIIMTTGIVLMLLQSISVLFKDLIFLFTPREKLS